MSYLVDEDPITSALMSPGMAMAAQAAQNLTNMRMGGQVRSPIDAYQQAVFQRARLDQQRQSMLQQQKLAQVRREQDNPFYEYEEALRLGYIPEGMTYQEFQSMGPKSAEQRRIESLVKVVEDPNATEIQRNAARIELGLDPRAGTTSSTERIAGDEDVQDQVITYLDRSEQVKSRARELGKSQGLAVTEYEEMNAMLPMLEQSVKDLTELANVATYTTAGRVFDTAAKELGFGSPEGATARAKLIAIADNQILPLLRQTFGAAFTEKEGERLRKTLIDENATPEAKQAQLETYIEMKRREVEAKRGRAGVESGGISLDDLPDD